MIKKISYILLLFVLFQNKIALCQYRDGLALGSISDLKSVQLKNFVLLSYKTKKNHSLSFFVPKNKISEIEKFSRNEHLFLNNIFSIDSVYYDQYWFFHVIDVLEDEGFDMQNFDSDVGKYNYSVYKINYDNYKSRGKRIEPVSTEKINKRITIFEFDCDKYYIGYINNNYVTHYHYNISLDYLNIELKNVMIPFVFFNYSKCQ